MKQIIYAQLQPGRPYKLVGAAEDVGAVERFREALRPLKVRSIASIPYDDQVPAYRLRVRDMQRIKQGRRRGRRGVVRHVMVE